MSTLATPMAVLHLLILVGLIRMWRKRKAGCPRLRWVAVPAVLLTLLSSPPAAYVALRSLEWEYAPSAEVPPDAGAIVVLSGAVLAPDRVRTKTELGSDTLVRCLLAADLHRVAPDRPVLVSGGPIPWGDGQTGAGAMRDFLITQGVPAHRLLTEDRSRNTYENAVECGRILRERGIGRVVLVTEAYHMRRAVACFRAQGIDVVPSACGHVANEYHLDLCDLIPNTRSAREVAVGWHEWVGTLVYWVRGRI